MKQFRDHLQKSVGMQKTSAVPAAFCKIHWESGIYKRKRGKIYIFPPLSCWRGLNSRVLPHPLGRYWQSSQALLWKGGLWGHEFRSHIKQKEERFTSSLSWAVDEAWTRDLFLTKEVLYHWATTALRFFSGAKIEIKIDFPNFLSKNVEIFLSRINFVLL